MTREEYEQRKLRLAEQLREGVALLEEGYQRQLRALELIWMADSNGDAVPPRQNPVAAAAPAVPPGKPSRHRLAPGQLREDVETVLAQVPEVFDRNDLLRALGYEPDRKRRSRCNTRRPNPHSPASLQRLASPAQHQKTPFQQAERGLRHAERPAQQAETPAQRLESLRVVAKSARVVAPAPAGVARRPWEGPERVADGGRRGFFCATTGLE